MRFPRARALAALGAHVAQSGPLAKAAIAVGALTTLGGVVVAFVLSRHGAASARALASVPSVASTALAWGAGVLLAFAASIHALRRDREEGIRALVRARGGDANAYLWARVAGLVAVVALVVVGGTLACDAAAVALAPKGGLGGVLRGALGSLAYAAAFAVVVAPVALAALGARSRAGGYLALLFVLLVPELLATWTAAILPSGWDELTSLPAILGVVRSAIVADEAGRLVRALVASVAVAAIAVAVVRQQMARVDAEGVP